MFVPFRVLQVLPSFIKNFTRNQTEKKLWEYLIVDVYGNLRMDCFSIKVVVKFEVVKKMESIWSNENIKMDLFTTERNFHLLSKINWYSKNGR